MFKVGCLSKIAAYLDETLTSKRKVLITKTDGATNKEQIDGTYYGILKINEKFKNNSV
jgi:ribosomal protein S4